MRHSRKRPCKGLVVIDLQDEARINFSALWIDCDRGVLDDALLYALMTADKPVRRTLIEVYSVLLGD
jgi:hypothetical protein